MELYEADNAREVGNWEETHYGKRVRIGEAEVVAHDAGHVLGSAQYEVITPEGNILYASHLSLADTFLTRRAEPVPCDLLVIEAPFPAADRAVPRESVLADIVKWALECVHDRRIPAFITDPIGDAQELVRTFNLWTQIPVIVHPRIARLNQIYENHGVDLRYLDASTDEALRLVEEEQCIVLVPRRFDPTRFGNFRVAYVSERRGRFDGNGSQKAFTLSTQPDLNQLVQYAKEVRPKSVLTFHGVSSALAQMISKRLGVPTRQLTSERPAKKPKEPKVDERRVLAFQEILMRFVETPGYMYDRRDIMSLGVKEGFRTVEVEEVLERLMKDGKLEYSRIADSYTLTSA